MTARLRSRALSAVMVLLLPGCLAWVELGSRGGEAGAADTSSGAADASSDAESESWSKGSPLPSARFPTLHERGLAQPRSARSRRKRRFYSPLGGELFDHPDRLHLPERKGLPNELRK